MKKHLKKICLAAIGVLLLSVFFCFGVSAAPVEGNYTYSVTDGEAKIMKVSTSVSGELTTPTTLGGYPVTAINGFAFEGCTALTKVTVSAGVRSLGYGTFEGCTNLSSIVLPESVTKVEYEAVSSTKWYSLQPSGIVYLNGVVIGYKGSMPINSTLNLKAGTKAIASGAFMNQTNLIGINFPEGFEETGTESFSGCFNLKSLTLPDSLKTIGSMSFYNCSKIPSVNIPESVTEIGYYAFDGCSAIKEVTFDSAYEINDKNGFFGCENIETVKFGKNAKSFAFSALKGGKIKSYSVDAENTAFTTDADGVLLSKDKTTLVKYPSGKSVITYTVPSTVKVIGKEAFKNASYLSILNIPGSVEIAEERAFEGCGSLTTVSFSKGTKSIGDYAFADCETLANITLPEGLEALGQHAFDSAAKLTAVVIPEGMKEIPDFAFFDCVSLKSVTIPDSVTKIGWSAFYGCTSFINIVLPDSITEIRQYAFDDTGWFNAQGSPAATYLGKVLYKFKGEASNNATVTVNEGTEIIANGAFANNDRILKVVMPSGLKRIGEEAFAGASNLTNVTFGNSLEFIGDRAFFTCDRIYTLNFPSTLKEIGEEAFRMCSTLSSVSFPKSFEALGAGAFDACGIKSFSVDSSNTKFTAENGVLYSKDKTVLYLYPAGSTASSFSIPSGVKEIYANAFYEAENLTNISFPSSLIKVGKNAFDFSAWYNNQADGVIYAGNVLYKYKGDAPENTYVTVKTGTVSIAEEALSGAGNVIKITVPDSVKYIGENAFSGTDWLDGQKDGIVMAGKVLYTYKGEMPENTALEIKDASYIADGAFKGQENLKEVLLGEGVSVIGKDAFSSCGTLGKVTVENSQCEIYPSETTIPKGVTISAPANSTAQKYAESQGREYLSYCFHINTKEVAAVESTCIEAGFTAGVFCNDCETYISGHEATPAEGHKAEVVAAVEPTCKSTGLTEGKKCSLCGEVLTAQTVIEKKAHEEETLSGKAATCTEAGLTDGKKCKVCGEITLSQTEIAPKGHNEFNVYGYDASCDKTGLTDGKKCSVCGVETVEQEMIPMTGHVEKTLFAVDESCTSTGLTEGKKCTVCATVTVAQQVIPATGHSFKTTSGKKVCTVCGYKLEENHKHTEVAIPGKAATCTEAGLTDGKKCSVCGDITAAQKEIAPSGHKFTLVSDKKVCSVCSFTIDNTHIHSEVILPAKAATYTEAGLTEGKKCSVCGTVTVAQKTVARKKLKKVSSLKVKSVTTSSVKLSWKKVTGADSYKVYYSTNGKKWKSVKTTKTTLTVKKLTSGKNYQFKVRAFAGKYYGDASSVVKTATKVKKVTLSSVKSSKAAQAAVSWKTVSGASGYVVEYSTSKKFKNKKTVTVKKGSSKKTTLKKLKSGKKYYVRVRAYKTVNGKKVYGSYSSVKTVKVK